MAWNSNPKVRKLQIYADEFRFKQAVVIGIKDKGFEVISYGPTKKQCDKAKRLADRIYQEIVNGGIVVEEQ